MSELLKVSGCDKADRVGDVIFVHGLDGDARASWEVEGPPNRFWPQWLGEDLPQAGVWSLDYDAAASAWRGTTMPLAERATDVLDLLVTEGLGQRPMVFITHSMGGLLVKQLLRHARDFGGVRWHRIPTQTKGIVFLSTAHAGSGLATWIERLGLMLRTTASVRDLQAHEPRLRELNLWFRENVAELGILLRIYYETRPTRRFVVVDATSADPGIAGVIPVPLDEDHLTIAKPASRQARVYRGVMQFVEECLVQPTAVAAASSPMGAERGVTPEACGDVAPATGGAEDQRVSPAYRYDVFISYRRTEPDRSFARQLLRDVEEAGFRVAIDERDFSPQATFLEEMERCVKESRFTLAVLSPRYLQSGNTTEEAIISKVLDMEEQRRRLIPLVIERVERPAWLYAIVGIDWTERVPLKPPLERLKQVLTPPPTARLPNPRAIQDTLRDDDATWCPELVVIPPGRFLMGSPPEEVGRRHDEGPQHEVTIEYSLAVSRYPVTFAEWDACTAAGGIDGRRPKDWNWGRRRRPVIDVTWYQAQTYVTWLSEQTKKPYRLLSEAEWEYACRAETTTRYFYGDEITKDKANFGRPHGRTEEVGAYPPNAFGIYDMHGNVFEWVLDDWHDYITARSDGRPITDNTPRRRVLRGGSWYNDPRSLRAAARYWRSPSEATNKIGFRVCRDV